MRKGKKGKKRAASKKKPAAKKRARSAAKKPKSSRRKSRSKGKKGKMPEALKRYWADKRARGGSPPIRSEVVRSSTPKSRLSYSRGPRRRRSNPSIPEPVMNAGKAVAGGFLAAAATLAGSMLLQKLPTMGKVAGVATQAGVGALAGAALGAAGLPAAGVVVAAGFGAAALQTARTPTFPNAGGVSGLLEKDKIRGLVEGQRFDSYQQAERAQVKGLVDFVGR
jgi:hypothetical protein